MSDPVILERDLLVLAKMLGRLGTDNPHERAVAGAMIHAWVTQRGLEWAKLLIPPEDAPIEVKVDVGGARPQAKGGAYSAYASGPYTQASPFSQQPGAAQQQAYAQSAAAQAAANAQTMAGQQAYDWSRGPAWGKLVQAMLRDHKDRLRGDRELTFLADQLQRARTFGNSTRVSDKQEQWLRDILGRAGFTW